MPLPGSAQDFLPLALNRITDSGTIHYYRFTSKDELWETPLTEIDTAAEETGRHYNIREKVQWTWHPRTDKLI
jgi:tRNA G37 N-methylase Trm5